MTRGNWIQLTSGGAYNFDDAEITGPFTMEKDLAWPLAGINRYVRHTSGNWSVAIHSICVAETIRRMTGSRDAAAAGLLHDAHEAVIGDIPTPVGWHLGYEAVKRLKEEVQSAIEARLGIVKRCSPSEWKTEVTLADMAALHCEKRLLLVPEPRDWNVPVPPHDWMLTMHAVMCELSSQAPHAAELFEDYYDDLVITSRFTDAEEAEWKHVD